MHHATRTIDNDPVESHGRPRALSRAARDGRGPGLALGPGRGPLVCELRHRRDESAESGKVTGQDTEVLRRQLDYIGDADGERDARSQALLWLVRAGYGQEDLDSYQDVFTEPIT